MTNARLTTQRYYNLAKERGFKWLGETLPKSGINTLWQCSNGHKWEAGYYAIRRGNGCPHCAHVAPKTSEDFHAVALKHSIEWLGKEPVSTRTKTLWRCTKGHIWEAPYNHVCRGRGCPFCSHNSLRNAGDYAALAQHRDFIWLGPFPKTTHNKTSWQCQQGHVWQARFADIQDGSSCPICKNYVNGRPTSPQQIAICQMIGGVINYQVKRYCIDVALELDNKHICIEYDAWYWHDDKRDKKRDEYLLSKGWQIIRIKSVSKLPTSLQLQMAIQKILNGETYIEIVLKDWTNSQSRNAPTFGY